MKIKKTLGTKISQVGNFSLDGYTVWYDEGDICDADS